MHAETIQSLLFFVFVRRNHLEYVLEHICLLLVRDSNELARPARSNKLYPENNLLKLLGALLLFNDFLYLLLHFFRRIRVVNWWKLLLFRDANYLWYFQIIVFVGE